MDIVVVVADVVVDAVEAIDVVVVEDELLLAKHKTINSLRLQENPPHHHSTKRFCNVAVQATKRKSTQSTQTKFGSIDHCFLSPLTDQQKLLRLSENLTKAIVDCKSTDLNNPDNDDDDDQQNLKKLLSTLDVDDDEFEEKLSGRPLPVKELRSKTVVKVSAGDMHSAALCDDGKVYVWGNFK